MGIKLITKNGDFLPLLYRIFKEGEDVKYHISTDSKIYEGILDKAKSAIDLDISSDDIVIFDMVGAGETAETLKSKNYTVIGGGTLNDTLELEREAGSDFMKKHGIQVPPTYSFDSFEECEAFLHEHEGERFVFKPDGNLETDLTFVPSSWIGLIKTLPYLKERCPEDVHFCLQEFVEGVEVSTEAWFNGTRFLMPINSTMEEKKFMAGNLGPNTGCMGNVTWAWNNEISLFLYEYLFKKLEDDLREAHYIGPLDINGIWNEKGIYGLEWTARFGYDAIQAFSRLFTIPIAEVFKKLPTMDRLPILQDTYALSIRVSIPPFPSEGKVEEVPIIFPEDFTKDEMEKVYLSDVYYNDKNGLQCAGSDGYVLAIASHSKSIPILQMETLEIADRIEVPNKQYRNDIGNRVIGEKKELEKIFRKLEKKLLTEKL